MYAICSLSMVPVRSEPSDKSEMVSQLLFGETAEILEKKDSWRKIRMLYDNYSGWVDKKQLSSLTDDEMLKINNSPSYISSDLVQIAIWNKNHICPLVIGSSLPMYNEKRFSIGQTDYDFDGNVVDVTMPHPKSMIENAYMYLNSPYLWGGRSPFGIDCSGFSQMVFKLSGIAIPRDAWRQAEKGNTINLLTESKSGDLAFFENAEKKIIHVGIILSENQIIHASGRVKIDRLDHEGIFSEELKTYSHKLRLIKRLV